VNTLAMGRVVRRRASPGAGSELLNLGGWIEGHGMAELLELPNQPSGVGFVVASGVPVGTEVVVGLVAFEHPVGRHQHRMRYGDLCPAHPVPFHQPGVLGGQVVLASHPADGAGGFDQHRG
jgi:hypothetical protein